MRVWIYNIAMALLAVSIVGCNTIYEFGDCPSIDEPHSVNFVMAISVPTTTRAAWEEAENSDERGSTFENRILPESLRVAIYTKENQYVGDVEGLTYWPINEDGSRYQFQGRVPMALLESASNLAQGVAPEYKFMVYANCQQGDNADIMYAYEDLDAERGAIPMWGVKTVNVTNLLNNRVQALGEISMLRAVAKVEVVVDEALIGCTIEGAKINYHNRAGYSLPAGWDDAESTLALDREQVFRGYRSVHTSPHELREVEDGRKYVIYLPEYDNKLFADYESKISLDIIYNSIPMTFTDVLQFRSHNGGRPTGEPTNIVRNTIYRFRITKVNAGGLELSYEVADWERSDNWEWVQHFDYPNYHNPVLPDSATRDGDSSNDIYPERPEMRYVAPNKSGVIVSEVGAFSCWFQMVSPADQYWLPTLNMASDRCEIRVYKEVDAMTHELVYTTESSQPDRSLKDGSRLVAYNGWYNIKIIPIDATYTGLVRFGITYTQDWMGAGSRYLFVNGEEGHIVWPNSGTEPRIIDIQQVAN